VVSRGQRRARYRPERAYSWRIELLSENLMPMDHMMRMER
jgi:hypothetical protein